MVKEAPGFQLLLMRTLLDDLAILDDHHFVRVADCAQAVGNDKAGAPMSRKGACWMRASVRVSTLAGRWLRINSPGRPGWRAMDSNWRWPWLRLPARSESMVW